MTSISRVVAGFALATVLLIPVSSSGQPEKKGPEFPKGITWKLQALDQEPLRVLRTEYDAKKLEAFWVIELTRDLDAYEDGGYWGPAFRDGRRTRVRFELQDADGVVLKTIEGRYFGEYVTKAGKRFGAWINIPPDMARFVKTVEAIAN